MGEKRLEAHLQFLLTNLAYEHETGRAAAIATLAAAVEKFPPPVLAARAELLFVPLVARLVNDASPQCAPCARAFLVPLLFVEFCALSSLQ